MAAPPEGVDGALYKMIIATSAAAATPVISNSHGTFLVPLDDFFESLFPIMMQSP